MNRKERTEVLNKRVDELVADLEQQISQGYTQDFLDMLRFYAERFASYSPTNWKLILEQNPNATRCAGYEQWKKLGCQVRKGEKAIYVRGPWIRKETDPDTGDISDRLVGYIALAVWDISQVDGAEHLPSHRHPLEGDYDALYAHVTEAVRAHGIEVVETNLSVLRRGLSYGGRIEIHAGSSVSEKCQTLFHEIGHEILHPHHERLELSAEQMELEAEALSFVLSNLYGLENPFSRDYIINWKGTVSKLQQSLSRIHQAVRVITSWLEMPEESVVAA